MAPWSEVPSQVLQRLSPAKGNKQIQNPEGPKKTVSSFKRFKHSFQPFQPQTVVSSSNKSCRKLVSTSFKLGSHRPPSPASLLLSPKLSPHLHLPPFCQQHLCGGFLKWWYPQIIHFNRVFHYKPSILGYHHFRKHPWESICHRKSWSVPILLRCVWTYFHTRKNSLNSLAIFSFSKTK